MRNFRCQCGAVVYFENNRCLNCGAELAFDPAIMDMRSRPDTVTDWQLCANGRDYGVCNWLAEQDCAGFCRACCLNETIPNLSEPRNLALWKKLEQAKRRLIYSLLHLGLPVEPQRAGGEGMAFRFIEDWKNGAPDEDAAYERVMTGHCLGTITINLLEADPSAREEMREQMNESYRTLLGHFRHESGHYYWGSLIEGAGRLEAFRALFGDERAGYAEALDRYYAEGPRPGWEADHVSAYASAHPWEDWAETWAHYLHMIDTLETAVVHGVVFAETDGVARRFRENYYAALSEAPFTVVLDAWSDLALTLNDLNRSMGLPDAYPFVITPSVAGKLAFVHGLLNEGRVQRLQPAGGV